MTEGASGETRPEGAKASGRDRAAAWKSPRLLVTGLVLVLLVAVGAIALAARDDGANKDAANPGVTPSAAVPETPREVAEVASFSGGSNQVTEPIDVRPNWELRWEAENSEAFVVELFDTKMISRGRIVQAPKVKSGTTFVSDEGMFTLGVTATGPWSIRVVSQRVISSPSSSPSTR